MAQNGKHHENKIITNEQVKESSRVLPSNLLTEEEQIELFAKLIIDIYLDKQYEKNCTHRTPGTT